jgi:hypothetical protein
MYPPRTVSPFNPPDPGGTVFFKTRLAVDLNNLTKNALIALGVACAMMAVLIVAASIFTVPTNLRVLAHLFS